MSFCLLTLDFYQYIYKEFYFRNDFALCSSFVSSQFLFKPRWRSYSFFFIILVTPALKVNKSLFAKCVHDTHCLSKEISGTKKESSYIFKSEARPSQSNLAQSIIDWETRTVMWSHLKKDTTIQSLLQSPLANRNQKSVERGSLMWWYSTLRFYRTPKIIFNDNIPPAVYVTAERIGFAQGKRRLVALMSLND